MKLLNVFSPFIKDTILRLLFLAVSAPIFFSVSTGQTFAQDNGCISIRFTGYDHVPQSSLMPGERAVFTAVFQCQTFQAGIIRGSISNWAWSARLPARLIFAPPGRHEISWAVQIPSYALGAATIAIIKNRIFGPPLKASLDFEIKADLIEYTGAQACNECHEQNYAAWQRHRHAPIPACEACHGPGRRHDEADTEEFIYTDAMGHVCLQCHKTNDGTAIEAEGGFIKSYQEHNETNQTAHGRHARCTTCHDPHINLREDRSGAVRTTCRQCHPDKRVALHPAWVACESCHMPPAVLRDGSEGSGLHRRGDFVSHIIRINPQAEPQDMFNRSGTAVRSDSRGPFLTLNFACLTCHDGVRAGKADMASVRSAAKLIHAR